MQKPKSNNVADTKINPAIKKPPLWPKLLTAVLLLGIAAAAVSLLPRGYSQDTSLIGKGENIVVLFHDPFTVDSQTNMDVVNALRSEYDGRVKFIVADKNLEQGKKFTEMYDINSTAFVFFAHDGKKINVLYGNQKADSLRKDINQAFNF